MHVYLFYFISFRFKRNMWWLLYIHWRNLYLCYHYYIAYDHNLVGVQIIIIIVVNCCKTSAKCKCVFDFSTFIEYSI